ncbi:hypothetical protein TRFO_05774 [Tritrichomonas foetus]|uniref:Myb-like domain-containing protein n=1 Tax=Tritrichomonas foetus TaxID=1144522 RepID=A0A1J4K493_9EUKA|nr:hypothetical protein TRFO_05774 [Tritrichomonas foetus]|eukprot:OHT05664.1 hypothetical protein TRFO_05774 [Tritrichomonas foetus]
MNQMNPNPHPENYVFFPAYLSGQPHVIQQIPTNYVQNASYFPVVQQMIIPMAQYVQIPPNKPLNPIQKKPMKRAMPEYQPFTPEEDQQIMNLVQSHGPHYDLIANTLNERAPSSVHNRIIELQRGFPIPSIQSLKNPRKNIFRSENESCFLRYVSKPEKNNAQSENQDFVNSFKIVTVEEEENKNQNTKNIKNYKSNSHSNDLIHDETIKKLEDGINLAINKMESENEKKNVVFHFASPNNNIILEC